MYRPALALLLLLAAPGELVRWAPRVVGRLHRRRRPPASRRRGRSRHVGAAGARRRALEAPFLGSAVEGKGRPRFHVTVSPILGKRSIQLLLLYAPAATERRIAVVRVT